MLSLNHLTQEEMLIKLFIISHFEAQVLDIEKKMKSFPFSLPHILPLIEVYET